MQLIGFPRLTSTELAWAHTASASSCDRCVIKEIILPGISYLCGGTESQGEILSTAEWRGRLDGKTPALNARDAVRVGHTRRNQNWGTSRLSPGFCPRPRP